MKFLIFLSIILIIFNIVNGEERPVGPKFVTFKCARGYIRVNQHCIRIDETDFIRRFQKHLIMDPPVIIWFMYKKQ